MVDKISWYNSGLPELTNILIPFLFWLYCLLTKHILVKFGGGQWQISQIELLILLCARHHDDDNDICDGKSPIVFFFCQTSKSVICHIHMICLLYSWIQETIRYVHITWGSLKGHCLLVGSHISTPIHLPGVISGATIVYSSYSSDMADDSIPWINHHGFVVPANGPIAADWLRKSPLWINPFDAMWFRVILLVAFWRYLVDKSDSRLLEFRESWNHGRKCLNLSPPLCVIVAQNRLVGISTPKVLRIKSSSFYLDTFTLLLMYQIIFVVLLSLWMEIQCNWFQYGTAG